MSRTLPIVICLITFCGGGLVQAEDLSRNYYCVKATIVKLVRPDTFTPIYEIEVNGKRIQSDWGPRSPRLDKGEVVIGTLRESESGSPANKGKEYSFHPIYREQFCDSTEESRIKAARNLIAELKLGLSVTNVRTLLNENGFLEIESDFNKFHLVERSATAKYYGHPGVVISIPYQQKPPENETTTSASKLKLWDAFIVGSPTIEKMNVAVFE